MLENIIQGYQDESFYKDKFNEKKKKSQFDDYQYIKTILKKVFFYLFINYKKKEGILDKYIYI